LHSRGDVGRGNPEIKDWPVRCDRQSLPDDSIGRDALRTRRSSRRRTATKAAALRKQRQSLDY